MAFLLDTNIVSELRKINPDPRVVAWHEARATADVYLSVLVIGEIRQGVERLRRRDPDRAAALDSWLAGLVHTYDNRILPITADIAQQWGRMNGADRPPVVDGLLAATAICHRLTLVTRNVADVAGLGVEVVNPFERASPAPGRPGRGG